MKVVKLEMFSLSLEDRL